MDQQQAQKMCQPKTFVPICETSQTGTLKDRWFYLRLCFLLLLLIALYSGRKCAVAQAVEEAAEVFANLAFAASAQVREVGYQIHCTLLFR